LFLNGQTMIVTIVSSAEGKQGHVSAEEANKIMKEVGANSTARILDPSGEIGKLYGAKTTPHMFVIGNQGCQHEALWLFSKILSFYF